MISNLKYSLLVASAVVGLWSGPAFTVQADLKTIRASDDKSDPTAAVYERDRVLDVNITLDADDWKTLRTQHRNMMAMMATDAYDYFKADVTIDGTTIQSVGVRKKGLLGSVISTRPSLKIKFDEYVEGQEYSGLDRLTLNNNNQDQGQIYQYLTYKVFRDAGAPAPRCNFAKVTVNGEYLGVYSNVESIKKRFLRRHFDDNDGNLYEGGDFVPWMVNMIQRKTNREENDRSDLQRVVKALESEDSDLVAELGAVVDIDAFLTFWAAEVLVGHWDSYSSNRNNFYAYHDPDSDSFYFIPWGADDVFKDPGPFIKQTVPKSVKAVSLIPRRLYNLPETRERYRREMRRLLEEVWDEEELLAEIDRVQELLEPHLTNHPETRQEHCDLARTFIKGRRAEIMAELDGEAPEWPKDANGPDMSGGGRGRLKATFKTSWGELLVENPFETGEAQFELWFKDGLQEFESVGVSAGLDHKFIRPGHPTISINGLTADEKKQYIVYFAIDPFKISTQAVMPVDFFTVLGVFLEGPPDAEIDDIKFGGFVMGTMKLDALEMEAGQPVAGSVEVMIF